MVLPQSGLRRTPVLTHYRDEMAVKRAAELEFYRYYGKKRVRWQDIENKFGRGIPDSWLACPGYLGWIEFKHNYKWQPRIFQDQMVIPIELTSSQYDWAEPVVGNDPDQWRLVVGFMETPRILIAPHSAIVKTSGPLDSSIKYGVLIDKSTVINGLEEHLVPSVIKSTSFITLEEAIILAEKNETNL